jgi:hypothetical protein
MGIEQLRQDQAAQDDNINIAEELGHIPCWPWRSPVHQPQPAPNNAPNPPDKLYPAYEPLIGSWVDKPIDAPIEDLPTSAHAAYYCARCYAENQEQISQHWSQLEYTFTATFSVCKKLTYNWTEPSDKYKVLPDTCTCPPSNIHMQKVGLLELTGNPILWVTAIWLRYELWRTGTRDVTYVDSLLHTLHKLTHRTSQSDERLD